MRHQPVRMLEIGVAQGRSMKSWPLYFSNSEHVFGIGYGEANEWQKAGDVDCSQLVGRKCTLFKGDQSDHKFLDHFLKVSGGNLDMVVDDGSHLPSHQARTLTRNSGLKYIQG